MAMDEGRGRKDLAGFKALHCKCLLGYKAQGHHDRLRMVNH
jgi:hypothetical protein